MRRAVATGGPSGIGGASGTCAAIAAFAHRPVDVLVRCAGAIERGTEPTPEGFAAAPEGNVAQLTRSRASAWGPGVRVDAVASGCIAAPLSGRDKATAILARTATGRGGRSRTAGAVPRHPIDG